MPSKKPSKLGTVKDAAHSNCSDNSQINRLMKSESLKKLQELKRQAIKERFTNG